MSRKAPSKTIIFKSIEDGDLETIHAQQNGGCRDDLSRLLGFDEPWAPMSKAQIKEKLDEKRKERRSAIFGLWSGDGEFVGMACFTSRWDPWCPRFEIIIWPEHRRKGLGRLSAKALLDRTFRDHLANATSASVPEWSTEAISFVKAMRFKECGRMRRAIVKDGAMHDLLCFDMLKREYLAVVKGAR